MLEKVKGILKSVKGKLLQILEVIRFVNFTMKGYIDGEEKEEYEK